MKSYHITVCLLSTQQKEFANEARWGSRLIMKETCLENMKRGNWSGSATWPSTTLCPSFRRSLWGEQRNNRLVSTTQWTVPHCKIQVYMYITYCVLHARYKYIYILLTVYSVQDTSVYIYYLLCTRVQRERQLLLRFICHQYVYCLYCLLTLIKSQSCNVAGAIHLPCLRESLNALRL